MPALAHHSGPNLTVVEPGAIPTGGARAESARRRRNRWCILVLTLGTLNLIVYTFIYAALGGDARNGYRKLATQPDGTRIAEYVIRGDHIRSLEGQEHAVSRGIWIYSYLHSISLPITCSAMIISMLVLARPHIIATMRDGRIRGETFVTAVATVVVLVTVFAVTLFAWDFINQLSAA